MLFLATLFCCLAVTSVSSQDCTSDSDCTENLACTIDNKCGDPCRYCGVNARCAVWNHFGACQCKPGFSGDPRTKCTAITSTTNVYNSQAEKQPSTQNPGVFHTTTQKTAQDLPPCIESKTKIFDPYKRAVCSGALLFEDQFNTGQFNTTKWIREQYMAQEPDYEFVTYERRAQNCFIKNGALHLVATLREDPTVSQIDLINGCGSSTFCSVSVSPQQPLLPPIVVAKIKSKFSFLYGKVEIRAQLPKGDWIVPQVNLDPPGQSYERLWVAYARGNQDLRRHETGEQIGNSVLYAGGVLGQEEPLRTHAALRVPMEGNWGDAFHVYTMVWAPDGIQILVDGEDKGYINSPYTSSDFSNVVPFNKEVVISLGIAAGGFSDFPDGSTSNGNRKPWKKLSVRPMANFYRSKDQWYPTWAGDNSALKIDYVKVWAL